MNFAWANSRFVLYCIFVIAKLVLETNGSMLSVIDAWGMTLGREYGRTRGQGEWAGSRTQNQTSQGRTSITIASQIPTRIESETPVQFSLCFRL